MATPSYRTLEGELIEFVGSGSYGSVWRTADGVIKVLRGHCIPFPVCGYPSVDDMLTAQCAVMRVYIDGPPLTLAEATTVARAAVWMGSAHPCVLTQLESGWVMPPATGVGRWAPLVLHTARGYYPIARDADLVVSELVALLPTLGDGEPGMVSARLTAATFDSTEVHAAIEMPKLELTHGELMRRIDLQDRVDSILQRWARRIIPLVADLLSKGVVHADIQDENIMLDADGESVLIDVDSCLRIQSAALLEPAVGVISLVPKWLRNQPARHDPDVLVYGMVFAALTTTIPRHDRPRNRVPAFTAAGVLVAHRETVQALTPETQELAFAMLGSEAQLLESAQRFADVVFATESE